MPQHGAGHVEEHLRQAISWQTGDVTEDHGEHDRGQERLDQEPQRTQDGLFEARDEISFYEQADKVAVVPDFAELEVPPFFAGGDNQIPRFRRFRRRW